MEIGKHQEITVYKYSYLLTKLHIVSKMKEFAYNMLSFVCIFNAIVSNCYKLSTLMLF